MKQVLLDYKEYEEQRELSLRCYALLGITYSSTQRLLPPGAPHRLDQRACKALLEFLRGNGFGDYL